LIDIYRKQGPLIPYTLLGDEEDKSVQHREHKTKLFFKERRAFSLERSDFSGELFLCGELFREIRTVRFNHNGCGEI
jgi:hypothetical protein